MVSGKFDLLRHRALWIWLFASLTLCGMNTSSQYMLYSHFTIHVYKIETIDFKSVSRVSWNFGTHVSKIVDQCVTKKLGAGESLTQMQRYSKQRTDRRRTESNALPHERKEIRAEELLNRKRSRTLPAFNKRRYMKAEKFWQGLIRVLYYRCGRISRKTPKHRVYAWSSQRYTA